MASRHVTETLCFTLTVVHIYIYMWGRTRGKSGNIDGSRPLYPAVNILDPRNIIAMYTEHKHQTERLIFEGIEPEQDLEWYHKLRSDPSVAQWLEPNIVAPWTKAKGAKSLQVDGALVE